jgi:hypothetical protein
MAAVIVITPPSTSQVLDHFSDSIGYTDPPDLDTPSIPCLSPGFRRSHEGARGMSIIRRGSIVSLSSDDSDEIFRAWAERTLSLKVKLTQISVESRPEKRPRSESASPSE